MKYQIKLSYTTGNSFGSEEREELLEYVWENIEIARENLKRIGIIILGMKIAIVEEIMNGRKPFHHFVFQMISDSKHHQNMIIPFYS